MNVCLRGLTRFWIKREKREGEDTKSKAWIHSKIESRARYVKTEKKLKIKKMAAIVSKTQKISLFRGLLFIYISKFWHKQLHHSQIHTFLSLSLSVWISKKKKEMSGGVVKGRKRVEASSADSTTSLLRGRDGSAFARWYVFPFLLNESLFLWVFW